ncbi:hypothetical protein EIN_430230 [Entamoeba invadens IP1]|uniref:Uncharacterized protein n=1 Tax=Entamoeba invadens IP1 TaxID=370355 RepID=A0A0A1UHF4_ENTIV|nr:hypothetical protein EIN_430230 [Entamoeba invadens IP1]ELP95227.1 hypothetical protein EIN_430230 [Entamoeba invadens IP1]|eukprot:XP_004261998.1 hypothetical protein EIN_430230 [Entamoeba invadens IP1]
MILEQTRLEGEISIRFCEKSLKSKQHVDRTPKNKTMDRIRMFLGYPLPHQIEKSCLIVLKYVLCDSSRSLNNLQKSKKGIGATTIQIVVKSKLANGTSSMKIVKREVMMEQTHCGTLSNI